MSVAKPDWDKDIDRLSNQFPPRIAERSLGLGG